MRSADLYVQFRAAKQHHDDKLLLFAHEDGGYVTFSGDAEAVARACQGRPLAESVSYREAGAFSRATVAAAGLEAVVARLVEAGSVVAILERVKEGGPA